MTYNVGYTSVYVVFGALILVPVIYAVVNSSNNRVPKGDFPSLLSPLAPHLSHYALSYDNNTDMLSGLRLPPGPPARLISGNAKDMPTPNHEWETYDRWAKEYGQWQITSPRNQVFIFILGEIVHVNVYGKHMIYLNTMGAAKELLEKRSSIYSDRFEFTMLLDLWVTFPENLMLLQSN